MNKQEKIVCLGPGSFSALKSQKLIQKGFTRWSDRFASIVSKEITCGMDRTDNLESDASFKQVIPYIVLKRKGKVFWYRRRSGKKDESQDGDKRLAGSISIGVGGHWRVDENFCECIVREYSEEFGGMPLRDIAHGTVQRRAIDDAILGDHHLFNGIFSLGVIWDESDSVSRVHLGIAIHVEVVTEITPSIGSALERHEYGWIEQTEVGDVYKNQMEVWTRIVHEEYMRDPQP